MKLKDFKCMLLLLVVTKMFSQNTIIGKVVSNGIGVSQVEILDKNLNLNYFTDSNGNFTLKKGSPTNLVFYKEGYEIIEKKIIPSAQLQIIEIEQLKKLSEVKIVSQRQKISAIRTLKDVEETAIYAGKKTEVIVVNNLTANKAINNARQIFSQVVGITMNESIDGGLQLSIGGRGLDPNRTANFNTRQNDYDISADVLGYPESYYATPTEAIEEIQVIRGAASLQYGTQFGGMINFKIKKPSTKPLEAVSRFTAGSFNTFANFTSLSGTKDKWSYYTFYNYKKGDGFRPNSNFESKNYFGNLNYKLSDKTSLHLDYTHFNYLAKQPGGLTNGMFVNDPFQSNRSRNWFSVNWNLFALRLKHKFNNDADFSLQLFGLDAYRKALGYRSNRVSNPDTPNTERDLIIGEFINWGAEVRYLNKYNLWNRNNAFLIGAKYYQSKNSGIQGPGSSTSDADFKIADKEFPYYQNQSSYSYPNLNISLFGENIFKITDHFSITPGFRYEYIKTQAVGFFRVINRDLAGNINIDKTEFEDRIFERKFALLGLGFSYKPKYGLELYANLTQNYRSVTFNDIRTASPSIVVADDITDEKGYGSDIGLRGKIGNIISFDINGFGLLYDNKIGEYSARDPKGLKPDVRLRDNIGTGITYGVESLVTINFLKMIVPDNLNFKFDGFSNISITKSKYIKSDIPNIKDNHVEFVPLHNLKTGLSLGYKNLLVSTQYTYVSSQFTDASNRISDQNDLSGIFGGIPSYNVLDVSASYKFNRFKLEASINNLTNNKYFTKRATGYPGPGIIPSEPRVYYVTLEIKL
ncbi:TonB-dependent receptor family protein [Flavobacterium columnare]|uniref:TonB-dependent receptor family protein n=1 Tax=Flavobacterium columnare TaxID=996 RepID=UPI000D1AD9D9|nr:TonB-dependent receptor [Flavobacterium columnare]